MEKGSMLLVEFTGRDENGKVFDTTDEKVAKENGLYRENSAFRPVAVIVGEGELIKGLDEELEKMKENEEKELSIGPARAFGERKSELVGVVPLNQFLTNKMNPYVGMPVEINGAQGKVQSISGGRVRVDFNNPLSGKTLTYKIKIIKEIKEDGEKLGALLDKYLPTKEKTEYSLKDKGAIIKLPAGFPKQLEPLKDAFSKLAKEKIKGIEKITFVENEAVAEDKKEELGKEKHKHEEKKAHAKAEKAKKPAEKEKKKAMKKKQ